jgi:hypothetical protein
MSGGAGAPVFIGAIAVSYAACAFHDETSQIIINPAIRSKMPPAMNIHKMGVLFGEEGGPTTMGVSLANGSLPGSGEADSYSANGSVVCSAGSATGGAEEGGAKGLFSGGVGCGKEESDEEEGEADGKLPLLDVPNGWGADGCGTPEGVAVFGGKENSFASGTARWYRSGPMIPA